MNGGLEKALLLVSAPPGYGKTTLVSGWLRKIDIPSAWFSLDERDNDPIFFLQYLIAALHPIVPSIQSNSLGVLQGMQPAPYEALVNIIINDIVDQASPLVLVLDDFHTIYDRSVLDICAYLIEHTPSLLHLVLLSRTDPPIPLSRLRARNQLVELRAEQLRFSQAEISCLLNDSMHLNLSNEDISALEARTEGWIASLQLAACSMRGLEDTHRFVAAFTGSNTYIMDFLAEEVLSRQTEPVCSFLVKTSILGRLCGSLCNAVIEMEKTDLADGQAMLETLAQRNLFLIPLDDKRQWFRYHHLFADVLNRHLELSYPEQLPQLHQRASQWLEQNGYIYDAIHHALMAKDKERAAHLVDRNGCELLMRGEVINLLAWIKAVEPYSQMLPWIAIQKAWSLALTGRYEQAEAALQDADRLLALMDPSDDRATMVGTVRTARAYRANMLGKPAEAADFTRQALADLPVSNDFSCSLRSLATAILGDASWLNGNLSDAGRAYEEAVQISRAANNLHMFIISNSDLGDILLERGQLYQAARIYTGTLEAATLPDGQVSPLAERDYAGLGIISYEMNRLEQAAQYAHQCIELSRRWGSIENLAVGRVMLAKLLYLEGNPKKAQEAARAVEDLLSEYVMTPWRSVWVKAALACLWITQGNLERASDLVQKNGITISQIPNESKIAYLQEPLYLVLLRLCLAREEYDSAVALSEKLAQNLEGTDRGRHIIENQVLQALAYQGKKDIDQALLALERAFSLAQPEGYVRIFLDEGEPMAKLLLQAKARRISGGYASDLLAELGGQADADHSSAQPLIEPLTSRELEVLKLIEAGCSNQDIANKMFISVPTVKRHISNIYAKLGVESRTQAVSVWRELVLFEKGNPGKREFPHL